jgi:DnaK suppressor protein
MDAINNKSVNEAALRQAEKKLQLLLKSKEDVKQDYYGLCRQCGNEIQLGRLKFRPESTVCMKCHGR